MPLKSIKIPLSFLAAGFFWAIISNPLITLLTTGLSTDTQDKIRSFNDLIFVIIVAVFLYFGIKRQQDTLLVSAQEYRRLFELNPNPMWLYDVNTYKFVKVNAAAVELYGYSNAEFLSMTIKDIRPPQDYERLDEYIHSMRTGIRKAGNWRHFKKSGELMYVDIASHHMMFENRRCSLVMVTDITQTVIKQEKINAQNKALQEIAWSNSHEVRHSLCSIISLVDLLKDTDDADEKAECLLLLQQCTAELDVVLRKMGKKVDELEKA